MKRYIKCASKRPETISIHKLRQAIQYRDNTQVKQFSDPETLQDALEQKRNHTGGIIGQYGIPCLEEALYADKHGIPFEDLEIVEVNYIIDTRAHIQMASLSDNEDTRDTVYVTLKEAIRNAVSAMFDELSSYDNDMNVVRCNFTLTIYGYGNHNLKFVPAPGRGRLISGWGRDRDYPSKRFKRGDMQFKNGDTYIFMPILSVLENNTEFKKKIAPAIVKYLAAPLDLLK